MQYLELGDGTQVNTAAIEAVTCRRDAGEWVVTIHTAGNTYRDRAYTERAGHNAEARARQNAARILAALTGEHLCRNCATALEPHRQLQGKWMHKLTVDNPDRGGCQVPEPSALADQWDTVEDALGDVA
jgi:hypothetical protein